MWTLSNGMAVTNMSSGNYWDFIIVIKEVTGNAKMFFFFFSSKNQMFLFVIINFDEYLCLWTIRVTLVESKRAKLWEWSYFKWETFNSVQESGIVPTNRKEWEHAKNGLLTLINFDDKMFDFYWFQWSKQLFIM